MWRWLEAGALLALTLLAPPALAAFDQDAALRASRAAIGRQVGDYALRDSAGRGVRLSQLRGKPLVVSFVYTGCFKVCPTATRALAQAVKQAERELGPGAFRVATIGFNLPYDTPQAMAEFARKQGVDSPNWLFLSPGAGSAEALAAEFGFVYQRTAAGFDHLLQVSIVDAGGRVYRQVYGESFDAPRFVGPLRELAQGAPQPAPAPEPAGFFDKVRLLCSVYDPATGEYRFNSAYLVEMLIGASVILFGLATVVVEWRRRRRPLG
jgi:protein SCO1/2